MFCRSLFVLLYFSFWSLSVLLRYTDSDYPFGIFKLFLNTDIIYVMCNTFVPSVITLLAYMKESHR
jgi:hypothetical protein